MRRRARLAGAIAGLVAFGAESAIEFGMRKHAVMHTSIGLAVGLALMAAWWGCWGSAGGAFAAAVRAGWRERARGPLSSDAQRA